MTDAIYLHNLHKIYKSKVNNQSDNKLALDQLNLTVKSGLIFGLLGPNGAGKSTLINILAGTVVKTSGQVKIQGIDIDQQPKLARSMIGIVPQEIVTDNFFPIWQSLEFAAGYYGIKPQNRITDELLKILNLYDKRNSLPQRLSGGMKRRFLVAKAMVHSPKILVLDEPTAGVDLELRDQLWTYVKKLNKEHGVTIIITTHYLAEAQELCDEIAFINNGKIIKQDSKNKLLSDLGSRHLAVEFDGVIDHEIANKFVGVEYQMIDNNKMLFNLQMEQNDFRHILEAIQATNLSIKDITINEPNLEDVFHKVVK